MALVQVGRHGELLLPRDIAASWGIKPGDWINVELLENKIVLVPVEKGVGEWSEEELRAVRQYLASEEAQTAAQVKAEESIEEVHR